MASSESYFVTVSTDNVLAGKVVVTPAVQPIDGCAHYSRIRSGVARPSSLAKNEMVTRVVDATLEFDLPRHAQSGDKVHWTSYGA